MKPPKYHRTSSLILLTVTTLVTTLPSTLLGPTAAWATTRNWANVNPGNLFANGNWSAGQRPNGVDDIANIANNPTNSGGFTLDDTWTLGALNYSNSAVRGIGGSGTLRFEASGGANALFSVQNGTINPHIPSIVLASTTEFRMTNISTTSCGFFSCSFWNYVPIDSAISGGGAVIKTGNSGLILYNPNNSYSGGTKIEGGWVQGDTIANSGINSSFGRGNFEISNFGELLYTGASASTNRAINLTSGDGRVGVSQPGTTLTLTGVISGAGNLRKSGAGIVKLETDNNYSGWTMVDSGSLQFHGANRLPDATPLYVASSGTVNLLSGSETIGTLSGSGQVGNDGTLVIGGNWTSTFSGVISGPGKLTINSGHLTLTGSNSYTGLNTIANTGTLEGNSVSNSGSDSAFGRGNFSISDGATLRYSGPSASTDRSISIGSVGGTIDVPNAGTNLTISGAIIGFPQALFKTGAGKLTLTGANSHGTNHILGGTLSASEIDNTGGASRFGSGNFVIGNGATMEYTGPTRSSNRFINLSNSGTVSVTDSSATLILNRTNSAQITGSGNLTKAGAGTLELVGSASHSGATIVNAGTLKLGNHERLPDNSAVTVNAGAAMNLNNFNETVGSIGGSGNVTLGSGTLTTGGNNASTTLSGTISGTGGLTKTGIGTWTVTGTNAYGGGTAITRGTLLLAGTSATLGSGNVTINADATLSLGNGIFLGGNAGSVSGNIANNGAVVYNGHNNSTYAGQISGSGNVTKEGSGTLTLTGVNTYGGTTTINESKVIVSGGDDRLPSSTVVVLGQAGPGSAGNGGPGKLQIGDSSSAPNQTVAGLQTNGSGTGNAVVGGHSINESRLTVNNMADNTFAGTLGGPNTGENNLGLTKMGSGKLTLTGDNSYSGSTLINGGTLVVNNSSGSATGTGSVAVNSGGTLAGAGSIAGGVSVNNGGTLAPGNSIESLDVGGLTFNAGGMFDLEIDSNTSLTAAADLVNADGILRIASGALLNLVDLGSTLLAGGVKFTLISYSGAWNGGAFAEKPDDSLVTVGVNTYKLNYNDTSGGQNFGGGAHSKYMTLTSANTAAVPEVSSFIFGAIVCVAAAGAHFGRRLLRRRRAPA